MLAIAVFSFIFASCGGGDKKAPAPAPKPVPKTETTTTDNSATANETVIKLGSNDQMQYDKKELKAKAGQKVTLTLTHTGKMPKAAMGHNFVLLKQGTDMTKFAQAAGAAADNGYIPKDSKDIIAHTKLIGGGESATVTFDAPAKGTYDFVCSFPGHLALMKGKFIVE